MNRINIKKWLNGIRIALVVVLILAEVYCFFWLKTLHICYGVYDYSVIYKEQLDIIFGSDYEIIPGESVYKYDVNIVNGEEFYECYNTWKITYKDSYGEKNTVGLTNADSENYSFKWHVYRWMWDKAEFTFDDACRNPDYEEAIDAFELKRPNPPVDEYDDIIWEFRKNTIHSFKDPDKLPHLYEMRFDDWFVTYPSYFYVRLEGDEMNDEILNDVLDDLCEKTGGRFNLEVEANDEERYYIMGEPRSFEKYLDYDLALYQEYERMGMFD